MEKGRKEGREGGRSERYSIFMDSVNLETYEGILAPELNILKAFLIITCLIGLS